MTGDKKLLTLFLILFVSLFTLGPWVNDILYGENNWRTWIEETPYHDYQQKNNTVIRVQF